MFSPKELSELAALKEGERFKDECGIVGIHGHSEASNIAYLALYAMQHRGQESGGIVSSQGGEQFVHRGMGYVADVFTEKVFVLLFQTIDSADSTLRAVSSFLCGTQEQQYGLGTASAARKEKGRKEPSRGIRMLLANEGDGVASLACSTSPTNTVNIIIVSVWL